ncbi:MFS transporter [SAR202 cluster bacterium AD-802-E10_MRT_200m]|nr:MFS transporter [SAR202 cluster bacterium AD-802-E10_MRT_200m]
MKMRKQIFYGWWIVGAGFSLQFIAGSLLNHSFTAYFPLLQRHFGWNRTVLSGAFALSRMESGLLGPLQGWLIEKLGPRMVVRIGMLMFGVGFILFSRTDSLFDYYFTFALMAIGASVGGFLTVATTVVSWFEKKRGVAMGIAMSGFGIGGLIVPGVAWFLMAYGWRSTAFFSGILIIVLGLPLAQLMRQWPEQYGYLPDGEVKDPNEPTRDVSGTTSTGSNHPGAGQIDGFTVTEALKTPAFWLLGVGHSMALLTVSAVSLHLVPHVTESVGLSVTKASTSVAVLTVFNILGQLGGGVLGDRFSKRVLMSVAMLAHSIGLVILAFAESYSIVCLFAIIHGAAWGIRGPMMTTIRADYFGRASFATIMGYSSLIMMVGATGGPLIAGAMADLFGGYKEGFLIIAGITGIGSIFLACAGKPKLPPRLQGGL